MILFKNRARQSVARQLAMLLESDVRLHKAVELVAAQQTSAPRQRALTRVARDLREGTDFSRAMNHSQLFRPGDIAVVEWAEEQGGPRDLVVALRLIAGDNAPMKPGRPECVIPQEDSIDLFASATGMERKHIHLL
jgi:type II secretory pathway component PulF